MALLEWISDELTILAEAFGEELTEQRQEIYCRGLADIAQEQLRAAFRRALYESKYFPKLAELREFAGRAKVAFADGRPGPEEAWARMPKGEDIERDSVVWCEEEQVAYGICRSLLLSGDYVAARMAFREKYERELAEARARGKPVRWSLSAGTDINHRMTTLAAAVEDGRVSLEAALDYVPSGRREQFALMLPQHESRAMLVGEVREMPELAGLAGILAKMRMDGSVPEGIGPEASQRRLSPADRTPEEVRQLRERLNAQVEFLRSTRNGY